jgi:NAD(P)H dehydrogenase (quinone)
VIVVTGATGRLGSQMVERLLDHVPAHTIGVSVRDVRRAAGLSERGIRVRAGDFTDPASLDFAFEGAEQVLIVSAAIRGSGAADANRAAIDAAARAGASRVLYTSHQAASTSSHFPPQIQHAATESHLMEIGLAYTSLRHGFYASTLERFVPAALQSREFRLPEDGPVSWTAHIDLAEVDVVALTHPGSLDGITPPLTGPEALDFSEVAGLLSELIGFPIARTVVDDEEWKKNAVENGMSASVAEMTLGMFRAARKGEFDVVDPTLETLLGRDATATLTILEELVAIHAA